MHNEVRRCNRCILPENYPDLIFDNKGICSECHSFEKRWTNYNWDEKEKEFELIVKSVKGKKRRYDCLVPVSGGKDSSYVLYLCTKKYKMNVLAVNFNNGFTSPIAAQNLALMARAFDADYVSWAPKWSTLKKVYRTFFLKTGDFCPPCSRAITAYTYQLAYKEKIPLIILGYNPKTDLNHAKVEVIDQRLFKDVMKNEITHREKKDFLMPEYRRFQVKRIDLPSFIKFDEKKMVSELQEVLGPLSNFGGEMHFDCMVSPVANWLRRRKWGFGKMTQKYSAFIRDGQMGRDVALEKAEGSTADFEPEALNYFMEMLDLKRADVDNAKNLSPLNFKHYDPKWIKIVGKLTGVIDKDYK